jgi:FtsP/CotA-like multicopper oxidase with cupredoxin domain
MEQFNDTPIVNGTAYPTTTVEPKSYRLRILNAANDRFWNLQWYVADPTTLTDSEVALNPAELAAAQTDPNVFPTPVDASKTNPPSTAGPDWIQIGTEGGFLPAPVVVDGQQPTTWITDPTRFDVGNVDQHSLLLAPAERADVIVDFSPYAGKTLILYNDAPAAFPARVPSYDYYTGAPDLFPVGAPTILPGYGPNTRTIMQVKVAASPEAPAFDLTALNNAFKPRPDGLGVFESGQHPIIVGQAAYNSAYGKSFAASSWCNAPNSKVTKCDGFARISDQGGDLFGFNGLVAPTVKMALPLQPKAIHDEMNSTAFDEFGRMQANMGVEAVPATPAGQNVTLYPYVNPATEIIDATNLPKGDVNVTPIATADGTQIWKITHNGVDTHPIHFHLYDVQLLNRVTWDNIIIPPDANELGWKDTVRVSPLEDTIVALRPIIPTLPFELPNSIRELNPWQPIGSPLGFNNLDANGNPTNPIINQLANFGWEYVWHCHILSHEEMDMMRPVSVALPPNAPGNAVFTHGGSTVTVTFDDNSIAETSFQLQRTVDSTNWTNVDTLVSPLDQPNIKRTGLVLTNTGVNGNPVYGYRVAAVNAVGYGAEFASMSVQSVSQTFYTGTAPTAAPTALTAVLAAGPQVNLAWRDNATNENGFAIQRSSDGGTTFSPIATVGARNNTGNVTASDATVQAGTTYLYRVVAFNGAGVTAPTNTVQVVVPPVPAPPTGVTAANGTPGGARTAGLNWTAVAGATSYSVRWSNSFTMTPVTQVNNVISGQQITVGQPTPRTVWMQVRANNVGGSSAWAPLAPVRVTAQ